MENKQDNKFGRGMLLGIVTGTLLTAVVCVIMLRQVSRAVLSTTAPRQALIRISPYFRIMVTGDCMVD